MLKKAMMLAVMLMLLFSTAQKIAPATNTLLSRLPFARKNPHDENH